MKNLLNLDKNNWFSNYNIAVFTIFFMNIQILPIEGWPISIPKIIFMAISPIICIAKCPGLTKATFWSLLFWIVTVVLSVIQFGTPRMTTFYYCALFLFVFNLYYNLLYVGDVFSIDDFISIIKYLILGYFICILLQEVSFIIGLRKNPLFNMMGFRYYELFRLNSLGIEPSSSARTLAVCFYALLKCTEYKLGEVPSIRYLYSEYKWVLIGFLYTMIALGSGTAIVCLCILSLYFLKKKYAAVVVIVAFVCYNILPLLNYEQINRAIDIFHASITGDTELVAKTDHSASTRVNIILDTFKYTDISDSQLWLGYGVDSWMNQEHSVASGIVDYGLISYILKLGLFFSCCFTGLFTIEVLMYILIFGVNIGNVAYGWGCLMIFATIRYFKVNRD